MQELLLARTISLNIPESPAAFPDFIFSSALVTTSTSIKGGEPATGGCDERFSASHIGIRCLEVCQNIPSNRLKFLNSVLVQILPESSIMYFSPHTFKTFFAYLFSHLGNHNIILLNVCKLIVLCTEFSIVHSFFGIQIRFFINTLFLNFPFSLTKYCTKPFHHQVSLRLRLLVQPQASSVAERRLVLRCSHKTPTSSESMFGFSILVRVSW